MIYVNCGCGHKYSCEKEWVNLDFYSNSEHVVSCNILKGLPFKDREVDVVYSSCMLEHFTKQQAIDHVREIKRVLKENGIIRIVVPDLENVCREYLDILSRCNSGEDCNKEYEYILIELIDQMTRTESGGLMADYWSRENNNFEYINKRTGYPKDWNKDAYLNFKNRKRSKLKRYIANLKWVSYYRQGKFLLSGELHKWMYDSYSLKKLLQDEGFVDVKIMSYSDSEINNWNNYKLEVTDEGKEYKPNCLYVEAKA